MMNGRRILVADFAPAGGVGSKLTTILRERLAADTHIRHEPLQRSLPSSIVLYLSSLVRGYTPHLMLWVFPPERGPEFTQLLRQLDLRLCYNMVVTGADDPSLLHGYLQSGVRDFAMTPLKMADVLARVYRALDASFGPSPPQRVERGLEVLGMIGQSPAFLHETRKLPMIARCDASVLISGETGTGKELFARSIHHLSPRADKPFVAINCGAIPLDLIENELFGHEKEAFTGATNGRRGLIQEAAGGTLLLDEIDSLPLSAQVKLLRFLQEKEIRPLGSAHTIKVDVRIVAATNVDPSALIEQGKLRQDLYYRINVLSLRVPPLRDRCEDIPLLLEFFLERHGDQRAREVGREEVVGFTPCALEKLIRHQWPGNVRELEHVVERALLLCPGRLISEREIILPCKDENGRTDSFQQAKAQVIADFERKYLTSLLVVYRGNVSRAAVSARKNRRAFFQLLQKHGIDANRFRDAR